MREMRTPDATLWPIDDAIKLMLEQDWRFAQVELVDAATTRRPVCRVCALTP